MNLILFHPREMADDGTVRLSGARAAHLLNVLAVTPGQQVRVGMVDGDAGIGTVLSVDGDAIAIHCELRETLPRPAVDLLLALPRPKVLRRLWAQLAAIGVGQIILTHAARVDRNYFDTHVLSPGTYGALLIEGLQQARDTRVPVVSIHRQFKVLIEDHLDRLVSDGRRLVAHPGTAEPIRAALDARAGGRVLLAVGPEGGWNAFELTLLEAHGFAAVGMGARSLRSDTACIALLALVHDVLRAESESRK